MSESENDKTSLPQENEYEEIRAALSKIIFYNDQTGFIIGVFRLRDKRKNLIAKGILPQPSPGTAYKLFGNMVDHPKYGPQFDIKAAQFDLGDVNETLALLQSSAFKESGLSKKKAAALYEEFGDDVIDMLKADDPRLREFKGISKKTWQALIEKAQSLNTHSDLLSLVKLGLSQKEIDALARRYTNPMEILEKDPFRPFYDLKGFSFIRCSDIANKVELRENDPSRVKAHVYYLISQSILQSGSTYLPAHDFMDKNNFIPLNQMRWALKVLRDQTLLVLEPDRIFLNNLYEDENEIAERFLAHTFEVEAESGAQIMQEISDSQRVFNITYGSRQKEAIFQAMTHSSVIINGGPGTGKSTITKAILRLIRKLHPRSSVVLCAPTGRAAKRMEEVTGMEARTIHSLLKWNKESDKFAMGDDDQLLCDFLIIDECSMIETRIFAQLLRALPDTTRIIMLGDENQLESVGPGKVFKDLIESGTVPTITLDEIYRQREDSQIVTICQQISHDEPPEFKGEAHFFPMETEKIPELFEDILDERGSDEDMQVLSPMYEGPSGINRLNQIMQDRFNPFSPNKNQMNLKNMVFREGDKVLLKKNMPEEGVYNGDIGRIEEIDSSSRTIWVRFDDDLLVSFAEDLPDYLSHGWCVSIHKAQGSEYQDVYVILPDESAHMLSKKLLYTAISRAKRSLTVIGNEKAFKKGLKRPSTSERYTALKERLTDPDKPVLKMPENISV